MKVLFVVFLLSSQFAHSQFVNKFIATENPNTNTENYSITAEDFFEARKLFQRNSGVIIGLQRGKYNAIELGGEAHWRKISLFKPHIIGATANLEYNFENNVIGYKAGMWMKRGRINLTYGANVGYFTNFNEGNRFSFGPSIGFRLLGFHLINGYNFLTNDKTPQDKTSINVNTLYMSLRYYFPVKNSFTWDRKTMKKKKERQKERAKKKKQREKEKDNGDGKGFFNFLKIGKKSEG